MSAIDAPLATGPTRPNAIRRAYGVLRIPGTIALGVIAAICITALLAPWIAPYDPEAVDLANVFAGPSGTHLLGTDALGRDLLSRLIWGARPTLQGPIIVVLASTLIGVTIGIVSAWTRGVVDATASRALDVLFAVPGIIFALVAVALFGVGLTAAVIGLTIAYVPYVARVCRGAALREASLPYIEACSVQGYSGLRICARHILPNLRPLIVAQARPPRHSASSSSTSPRSRSSASACNRHAPTGASPSPSACSRPSRDTRPRRSTPAR